jgi:dihydrofolate reductase
MRKVVLEEWISLDGYAADRDGQLNFFPSTEANRYSDQDQLRFLDRIDTILLGRVTYELFAGFWPTATVDQEIIADRLNALPKVVFSESLEEAPWGTWPAAKVVSGDPVWEVAKMKEAQGKDMVLWGSLTLAQALMRADLIDEYHIQICPTLVGGGRMLFLELKQYARLRLVEARTYPSGVVYLHYEPAPKE